MTVDLYTKGVLTVIALSLALIAVRGFTPIGPALAQTAEPVNVRLCDEFFTRRCAEVSANGHLMVELAR